MSKTGRAALLVAVVVAVVAIGWFEVRWLAAPGRLAGTSVSGPSEGSTGAVHVYPIPGTPTASPETTISFRGISDNSPGEVTVTGDSSGKHTGTFTRHSDGRGVSFVPTKPFDPGETVRVSTSLDVAGEATEGDFQFTIAYPSPPKSDPGYRDAMRAFGPADAKHARGGGSEGGTPTDAPQAGRRQSGDTPHAQSRASRTPSAGTGAPRARTPVRAPGKVRSFVSRRDLRPPKLKVKRSPGKPGKGYVFLASKNGVSDKGPLIANDQGEPVWFHENGPGATNDLKVQKYQGEKVLTWWRGYMVNGYGIGEHLIMNDRYQRIATVGPANGYLGADLHDFILTPRGTALQLIYNPVIWDASSVGGSERQRTIDAVVQEVDIKTGAVLFEWHSLGNIGVKESYVPPPQEANQIYAYIHPNSIDIDRDGNLLLSIREMRAIYKVDRQTGERIWKLGGKNSDFTMGPGTRFIYQHDARRQPDGTITLFDNGARPGEIVRDSSRGVALRVNMDTMKVTLAHEYPAPRGLDVSASQGNMQTLPNGHVFIGWGSEPGFTEYTEDGKIVHDVRVPSDTHSYRAFRFQWEGHPTTDPSIAVRSTRDTSQNARDDNRHSQPRGDDKQSGQGTRDRQANLGHKVTAYVSWNGATEVTRWQLVAGPAKGKLRPVRAVPRTGFETKITAHVNAKRVAVRAMGDGGQTLGKTKTVTLGKPADKHGGAQQHKQDRKASPRQAKQGERG